MQVSYQTTLSNGQCIVCFDSFSGTKVIAHFDNSHHLVHPLHQACLREWMKHSNTCPLCRKEINIDSVLTFKERTYHVIRPVMGDAIFGAAAGITLAMTEEATLKGKLTVICGAIFVTVLTGIFTRARIAFI